MSEKNHTLEVPVDTHVDMGSILSLQLESLVHTDPSQGLSDDEIRDRLEKFGYNEIKEKKVHPILRFLSYFGGSISIMLEIAAIVAGIVQDWIDFGILIGVLLLNAVIGFIEESKAENALDALKNTLALKCRCFRNGKLVEIESRDLVPGDIVALRLGDIIPADCRLLGLGVNGDETKIPLQIDQSALTGESLPVNKSKGQTAYSSSIIKQGQMLGVVTKTGINTYIGRAANLISSTHEMGHFQKIVGTIGNFLIVISLTMCVILFFYQYYGHADKHKDWLTVLKEVLILLIAAIPVGMQTVLTVTLAVGAKQLADKQVIVKRLTAIEELASVSILCSDKTGTLTLNELTFDKPYLAIKGNSDPTKVIGETYSEEELLLYAYLASEPGATDAIESATRRGAEEAVKILKERSKDSIEIPGYKILAFVPFNPVSKLTEATVVKNDTNEKFKCIKGAPQVIIEICNNHKEASKKVEKFALMGLRSLAVARTIDEDMKKFEMIGLISLLDPPRVDSAETIKRCMELGIQVKMITGDQLIIAKEVAKRLEMPRTILDATKLTQDAMTEEELIARVMKADGFAQVIPEHKYQVVDLLQKRNIIVGMTGDGVNDAPALKKANVGIAVHGCTDAARSAADIVLLAPGLSTIVDGVITSRAIFQRMRSYAIYRITSTIHFLLFFFISIIAFDFSLPERLIILITVLNDAATLVISVDNAKISQKPDKWRLGQLLTLSTVLGLLLMGISYAHYFLAVHYYPDKVDIKIVQTIMYLQISSCPHFVIFSTRLPGWFWEAAPSWIFVIAVGGTQVFAMFMSIYGIEALQAYPIGWPWGIGVMAISSVSFMFLDVVKTLLIRNWSFELTAKLWPSSKNKEKLRNRIERASLLERVDGNFSKLRKAITMAHAVSAFKSGIKHVKQASRSILNLAGDRHHTTSRRASLNMSSRPVDPPMSKQASATVVNVEKSTMFSDTIEAQEDLESPQDLQSPQTDSNE